MFQPTEFLDGNNIIIIEDIPYYRYTGVTYKEKLKNGLSFDYVFGLEYCLPNTENEDNIDNKENNIINKNDLQVKSIISLQTKVSSTRLIF